MGNRNQGETGLLGSSLGVHSGIDSRAPRKSVRNQEPKGGEEDKVLGEGGAM